MEIEETPGAVDSAPSSDSAGTEVPSAENTEAVEDSSQGMSSGIESVLAAMDGLPGGGDLLEGLNVIQEAEGHKETGSPVVVAEEKPTPDDPNAVAAGMIKDSAKTKIDEESLEESSNESLDDNPSVVDEEAGGEEKITIKSPVFGGETEVGKKTSVVGTIKYEGSDVANKYIKEQTGYDNLESLVNSSLKLQEKVSDTDSMVTKISKYEEVFSSMPAQLYEAVDSYLKGEDWKSPIISKPNLDFARPLEDQSDKSLVENYMPNQFTQEDWEDYKGEDVDPRLKQAIDIAVRGSREKFSNDRDEIEGFQAARMKADSDAAVAFNSSIDRSIDHLEKSIDGIDPNYVKNLKKELSINKLKEIFLENDGTFKKEAALRLVMAENGYSMMDQYRIIAERQTETKERQGVLERTPEKPKAKKAASEKGQGITPDLKMRLDQIGSGLERKAVY